MPPSLSRRPRSVPHLQNYPGSSPVGQMTMTSLDPSMHSHTDAVRWSVVRKVCLAWIAMGGLLACDSEAATRTAEWPVAGEGVVRLTLDSTGGMCPTCIAMESLVTIGDTIGEGYVEATRRIVRDSTGRYWLSQRDRLKVFDADGTYIRQVGRPGQGPMEFLSPQPVHVDANGYVHILDVENGRETVVSHEFQHVMDHRLPSQGVFQDVAPLPGSHRYVVNMWVPTPEGIGLPLHVIRNGRIERSFGADLSSTTRHNPFTSLRIVATDEDGHVFSAKRFDYEIEVWTSSGRKILSLTGPALNSHEVQWAPYNLQENPIPREILDIHVDSEGKLWVLIQEPAPDWRDQYDEVAFPDGTVALQLRPGRTRDSVYTSVVHVMDPREGVLLGTLRWNGLLSAFAGDRLLVQNAYLADGTPQIIVWRFRYEVEASTS